jgi:hypothetical protein
LLRQRLPDGSAGRSRYYLQVIGCDSEELVADAGLTRKKRHHFRPVLHLRHFVDATGQLWVHDKTSAVRPFQQTPANVGFEKNLYALEGGPDGGTDAFEDWLAQWVDGPAAIALSKAAVDKHLTTSERSSLAAFIAAQDLRTPKARDIITSLFESGLKAEWTKWEREPESLADAIRSDSGTSYSPQEIVELLGEFEFRVTNNAWLGFAQDMLNKLAKRLYAMSWSYARAPDDEEFITTDIGVAKCSGRLRFLPWVLGFVGGRDVWVFPLTPDAALVLSAGGPAQTGRATPNGLAAANSRLWEDAERFIYARSKLGATD